MEFSSANLLHILEQYAQGIRTGAIPTHLQENLWNTLTWDKNSIESQELIKYLFAGYYVLNANKDVPMTSGSDLLYHA